MSEPHRRFFERLMGTPTYIGPGSVIVGDIRGKGPFVVSGEIHGDGEVDGGLHLAVGGTWHGNIQAYQAIIAGKIIGALKVEDRLEIGYTAVIRGKVTARTIAIAEGAIVEGEIEVTSGESPLQFQEHRDRERT